MSKNLEIVTISVDRLEQIIDRKVSTILQRIESVGNPARWVKSREAMEVLGCSKSTLLRHVNSGMLVPAREGRDLSFCLADLIAFKRKNQNG